MTAQETNLLNAFETTLTGTIGASDLTFTVNSVTDSASNTLAAPCYLILNPDSATNREVVLVTSINAGTKTLTLDNINKRYLTGSAATSGLSHASGSVVRMSPVQQHIEDINDRVDTVINEAGTAVNTTLFLDEDDMSSNSATKGVTQQSVKAYVDSQVTAQDLDFRGDSNTGSPAVDLDSQNFTIAGGEGIDTSGSGQTLTVAGEDATTSNKGIASFSSDNFAVSSGAVTIKDSGVSNDELAGSIANAKLANSSITVTDGSSSTSTALGGTITFSGTSNEVEVAESSGTITIGLPSSITVNVTGNVTGNVSGSSGSTTGNAATATALETARTIGGVSFDGTANIDLPGVNTAGNQNTSGSSASTTGNAATATALQTARTIAGQSFDGTGNITIAAGDLSNVSTSGVSDGQVLVYNNSASEFQPGSVGSATALIDGDSDFTLSDGVANGIHYELDNTDMADWNQGGVALTAAGGIFRHNQTQSATYTIAATEGTVLAGPITITGTVTNAGTMVIL